MSKGEGRFESQMLGFDPIKDYYAILGVTHEMSETEIKSQYRKEARRCHPDLFPRDPVAEARFKDINEAYEVLGNSDKRNRFDELNGIMRTPKEQARTAVPPLKEPTPRKKTRQEEVYEDVANLDTPTPPRKEWKA